MRLLLLALPSIGLLAGCAGYAIDYTKPKTALISPALARYSLDAAQSQCVADKLQASLSVWQLRQLAIMAEAVTRQPPDTRPLTPRDLVWAATHVKDPKVRPAVASAADACGLPSVDMASVQDPALNAGLTRQPTPTSTGAAPAVPAVGAAVSAAPTWINLGAAPTGQAIAVDASSIEEAAPYRRAWFRLTNPGGTERSANAYLLRIDCTARTINSMALRRHGADGGVAEQRDFGPGGEGAAPIEAGTVMEIAYLAMCT